MSKPKVLKFFDQHIGDKHKLVKIITTEISKRDNICNILANLPYFGYEKIKHYTKTLNRGRG